VLRYARWKHFAQCASNANPMHIPTTVPPHWKPHRQNPNLRPPPTRWVRAQKLNGQKLLHDARVGCLNL
jgi:hypothetical protein